jgi:hypothetical protein
MKELCGLIAKETDRVRFLEMVAELNQLFEEKEQMLKKEVAADYII